MSEHPPSVKDPFDWADALVALGRAVRAQLLASRDGEMHLPVGREGGDTIYAIDRAVEGVLIERIEAWPASVKPLVLVAEGLGASGCQRFTATADARDDRPPRYTLIVDPIDGTRGIMYDKRAAWFIAAVCPAGGRLADSLASCLLELPVSKAGWADTFVAMRGRGVTAVRDPLGGGAALPLTVQPSRAADLRHGFAQVSNFFPGTKVLASALMEAIAAEAGSGDDFDQPVVFDDQYLSTAGQFVELMCGRDRFCCDLRPLLFEAVSREAGRTVKGFACHPYDAAGLLVAQEAGVILTDGFGRPLDAPLSVDDDVHWCGYANAALQAKIQPVIQRWFARHGITPDTVASP